MEGVQSKSAKRRVILCFIYRKIGVNISVFHTQHMHSTIHTKRRLLVRTITRGINKAWFPTSLPFEAMGLQHNSKGPYRQESGAVCVQIRHL